MDFNQFMDNIKDKLDHVPKPISSILQIVVIFAVSLLVVKIGSFIIRKAFAKQKSLKLGISGKKVDTVATLSISIFRYAVYIMAVIIILTNVFNLTSILAAASIGGVALGLGAQSLIRDIISGFFILMEDQFAVGDLITIEGMTGTVEEMELRVTRLRHFNGDLFIVPNGEIKKLTNHTRGNKAVIVDIPLTYSTNIAKALGVAEEVCTAAAKEYETLTEPPKVLGITDMGKDGITVRITAKTAANAQWEVERGIRAKLIAAFDREKLPFSDKNRVRPEEYGSPSGGSDGR